MRVNGEIFARHIARVNNVSIKEGWRIYKAFMTAFSETVSEGCDTFDFINYFRSEFKAYKAKGMDLVRQKTVERQIVRGKVKPYSKLRKRILEAQNVSPKVF